MQILVMSQRQSSGIGSRAVRFGALRQPHPPSPDLSLRTLERLVSRRVKLVLTLPLPALSAPTDEGAAEASVDLRPRRDERESEAVVRTGTLGH